MKKILSLVLTLVMLATVAAVPAMAEETYREPVTLKMFSGLANFAGVQGGWFGKELKDRFNVTLDIASTNVDGNAWTSAVSAGDLGDIICLGDLGDQFVEGLNADLILDWSDIDLTKYPNITAYLGDAMKKVSDFAASKGHEGIYGFTYAVALEEGAWAELTDPTYALQIRYDAWEKAGKPALKTLEDLPAFLKALQDAVPANPSGEKVYAYGGFPDWEDCVMKFTWDLMTYYGYQEYDFLGVNYATRDVVNPLEENSLYYRALKVNNQLYREGLFDPESTSQNFDTYSQKLSSGRYLMALWGWIIGNYNSAEKAANKDGFVTFMIEDSAPAMQTISKAGSNRMWALGSKTENAERALEVIDWLCSEEGIIIQNYGPKGLCWDYGEDGVPYMTDFGWQCQEARDTTQMPEEFGGGTFQDGESKINHETLKVEQLIPGKTYSFSYKGWPCYAEHYATALSTAWSTEYANGATSGVDLYRKTGKVSVESPAAIAYSKAQLSEEGQQKRAQFAPIMKEYSWKCVYSATDEEFDSNWKTMVETCKNYGYDDVVAEKMTDIENCFKYMDENDVK
ncbi:MAG: extracellular solute-binding protein [Clostridiales bacterium]|nr:extracellular solute-binding protein [Clostridiales bacterium]